MCWYASVLQVLMQEMLLVCMVNNYIQLSNFKPQLWVIFAIHKNFEVQVGTAEASKRKEI